MNLPISKFHIPPPRIVTTLSQPATCGITVGVRRLVLLLVFSCLLAACGKKVRVATVPASTTSASSELVGMASYYAEPYHGRRTANGEIFDTYQDMTAAHKTLPFNTVVKVFNTANGRDVEVRINDRGPFVDGRVIDLSLKAAREIDMVRAGVVPVRLEILKEGTPSSVATRVPPPASVYTVQVGAFDNPDAAESLKRDLENRYRDVTIQTFSADRTVYRVRVGREPDLASAERLAKQLREDRFDPFVVRVN
jgi:rare lipoprotein A